ARRGEDKDPPAFLIFPHSATPPRRPRRAKSTGAARIWAAPSLLVDLGADKTLKYRPELPERSVKAAPRPLELPEAVSIDKPEREAGSEAATLNLEGRCLETVDTLRCSA
ncbi:MAG: hypothetical protein WCI75_18220, partial [candidate division NC10 bacterium]